ncbi:MAG: TGS domain-containing protein, partial [Enterococcus sp.]
MVKISFPDGSTKEFDKGITGLEIAKSISSSLAKKALAVVVNGQLEDLNRAIDEDAELKIVT